MKTVILCGGRGTRLGKHGENLPKALIEIGDEPIIRHILKLYSHYGLDDFVLCLGFLGDKIKRYFLEQSWVNDDFWLSLKDNERSFLTKNKIENWNIAFAETGLETNTGGRLNRVKKYLKDEENFCVTYGDGLADMNISNLIKFHKSHGKIATLTTINPHSSFG